MFEEHWNFMKQEYPIPVVGGLIFNQKGELLLIKSHKWSNKYVVVGGRVEIEETLEQALKREAKEETNLDIHDLEFLSYQEFIYNKYQLKKGHFILFNFICRTESNEVKLNREAQEFIWVEPKKALELDLLPETRESIKKYLETKN